MIFSLRGGRFLVAGGVCCGFLLGVFTLFPLCSEVVGKNDRGGGRGDSKYVFPVIGGWRVSNALLPF